MTKPRTSVLIRDLLRKRGEMTVRDLTGAVQGLYVAPKGKPGPSYASIRKTVWMLHQLGLVKRTGREAGKRGQFRAQRYGLVTTRIGAEAWKNPSYALWPPKKRVHRKRRGRAR